MVLIVGALGAVVVVLLMKIPVSAGDALAVAGAAGRMKVFDFSFNLNETYTFWSGIIGGTFLMLSYFGTDQSQVQRYLTAKSVNEARSSLLISAYWKIPLQGLILLIGVLIFVFYLFQAPPMLWNPTHDAKARDAAPVEYAEIQGRYDAVVTQRSAAAQQVTSARASGDEAQLSTARAAFAERETEAVAIRSEALDLAARVTGEGSRDVNYIVPRFVLNELPIGLAGLFIAAIMAAAMSSIAAELNSLSTATVMDFYKRWVRAEGSDRHFLNVSKIATGVWGLFACIVATYAASLGSLIEVVNRFGSFFYGSILGVFLLAMVPWIKGTPAFIALIAGMLAVGAVSFGAPDVSFLWYNVIGAGVVFVVGSVLSLGARQRV
jgi:Na+/proline symporter